MNKKLMIYPFNKRVAVISECVRLLKGYILTAAVAPKSYGYEGKDASCVSGGEATGIKITSSFQESLAECDTILFAASTFAMSLDYYEEKIRDAVGGGKEVLITKELEEDFINAKRQVPVGCEVLGGNSIKRKTSYNETKHVREISVPVMTIFQVGEFCGGFHTLLLMGRKFEEEGYQVSRVTSDMLGSLFDIHMLPDYLYDQNMSYEDKIVNLNNFLISIVETEKPDVLLVEAAEAILPYNDRITNRFGVVPAIISRAVLGDVSILNLYYEHYDNTYLDQLRNFCRYALNAEINYINIANTIMDIQEFNVLDPIHYVSIDLDTVMNTIEASYYDYDCMFFNTNDLNSVDSVYYDIIAKLSENKETVRIW